MAAEDKFFLDARDSPSILNQLAEKYSYASLGYPPGLIKVTLCEGRGTGLVAARMIKRGEMVFDDLTGVEIELTENQLNVHLIEKTPEERKKFLMHCYCHDGVLWYVLGIGRFTNHSKNPSCGDIRRCSSSGVILTEASPGSYALRDIKEGEEITEDYSDYQSLAFYEQICLENEVESTSVCAEKYS
eukprot:GFUD01001574.1.p1 GENE.GFUD01001574.1~~GFUD01001574.1.p1  ORF type:complete len:194 (+),score=44.15 GFUD01001574.1:24-584(+)